MGTIFYAASIILSILASVRPLINNRFLRGKKVTDSTVLNPASMSFFTSALEIPYYSSLAIIVGPYN